MAAALTLTDQPSRVAAQLPGRRRPSNQLLMEPYWDTQLSG